MVTCDLSSKIPNMWFGTRRSGNTVNRLGAVHQAHCLEHMPILSSVLSFVASYGNVVWWLCLLHLSPPCEGLLTKIIVSVNRQYSSKGCQCHTERYFSGCSLGWGLSRVRYSSLHYCSDVDSPWFPVHIFSRYNTLMYLTKLFTRLVSLCTCTRQEC